MVLISVPPWSSSFVDLLRPPVKAGRRANDRGLGLQGGAAGKLGVLQRLDAEEMLVDQGVVGEWPEVFGRLQLGGIGRQEQQMNVLRDPQLDARVPTRAIQHEHDLLLGPRPDRTGKDSELRLEQRDGDRGGQVKEGPARGRMDKADEIAPLEAVLDGGERSLPDRRPHAAQHRFEANAMLIRGPELHVGLGERRRHRPQQRADLFLNSACCSGSASTCCGRGTCWLCLSRCR